MVIPRPGYHANNDCEQNGYQSDKLIFCVWIQTRAPKLKTICYIATWTVFTVASNQNFVSKLLVKNHMQGFPLRSAFLSWKIISNFHMVSFFDIASVLLLLEHIYFPLYTCARKSHLTTCTKCRVCFKTSVMHYFWSVWGLFLYSVYE